MPQAQGPEQEKKDHGRTFVKLAKHQSSAVHPARTRGA